MKQRSIVKWIVGCLAFLLLQSAAAQSSAKAELHNASILIGDQVTLRLHAGFPRESQARGFDFSVLDTVKGIEVLKVSPPVSATPGQIDQEVVITSFEAGIYTIPALLFSSAVDGQADSVYTDSLVLEVKTLPIANDSTQLQPIKHIIAEPQNLSDWAPFMALGLGLLALGILLYFVFRKPRKELEIYKRAVPKLPPHEIAIQKLDELRAEALWQKGELKAYYSRLTYIIREYLEHRFHLKALESTSDEIVDSFRQLPVDEEKKAAITRLLYAADLVKFAKAVPEEDAHDRHWENVRQFVLATQPLTTPEDGDTTKP